MSFFNKKEEVLSIELTNHGRELLARGLFKPVYYSFFDNDVIYNSANSGFIEVQNEIEDRITKESPILKPLRTVQSLKDDSKWGTFDLKKLNETLGRPIGASDSNTNYYPAWNINFVRGGIKSINYPSSSAPNGDEIPEIVLEDCYIDIVIEKNYNENFIFPSEVKTLPPKPNGDGTYVKIIDNFLLLTIEEKNVVDIGDNFIVEFIYDDGINEKILNVYDEVSVSDYNKVDSNNIMLDTKENESSNIYRTDPTISSFFEKDRDNLELYFNFSKDNTISLTDFKPERLYIYDTNSIDGTNAAGSFNQPDGTTAAGGPEDTGAGTENPSGGGEEKPPADTEDKGESCAT